MNALEKHAKLALFNKPLDIQNKAARLFDSLEKQCLIIHNPKHKRKDKQEQEHSDRDRIKYLLYMLSFIQPYLQQLHKEQHQEMKIEAKRRGQSDIIQSNFFYDMISTS